MAASPYRCTVTLDSTKFNAVSASVRFHSEKDRTGMPEMGSLSTTIRIVADLPDDKNLPFSAIKKFFDLANVVTRDKIKEIKIEFWKDDSRQDALCSYTFKGWISRFETANPHPLGAYEGRRSGPRRPTRQTPTEPEPLSGPGPEPALNQENFKDIKMSN